MLELIKEIGQTAKRNKLRTTLTGFAVAWGIFMLIVLLGAGNGLINAQTDDINRLLSNSIMVGSGTTTLPYEGLKEGRNIRLKDNDLMATQKEFEKHIDEVGAIYSKGGLTMSIGQQYLLVTIAGVFPNHNRIEKSEMLYGRFINEIDMRECRKVIVLGNNQAKELTKDVASLVGKYVNVGKLAFRVVGVFKEDENGRSNAMAPYTTMKRIYDRVGEVGRIEFSFHGLTTEKANEAFERDYRRRLAANHRVHPDDDSAIWTWNRYTQNMQMETAIGFLRTALWIVGLFTLLSGIVGVSNIMLITVKERTHEFGIRKAIGAKPWSVLKLIITESVVITTFFGYIGMVLGVLANEYMDATLGHEVIDTGLFKTTMFLNSTVGLDVCFEATFVMVVAGTLAGLIPAYKASRIRPIEALRAD